MPVAFISTTQPGGPYALQAVDTTSLLVLYSAMTANTVISLALSPDQSTVYSLDVSGNIQSWTASSLTLLHSTSIAGGVQGNIITSGDGTRVFVSSSGVSTVYVYNAATLASITTISSTNCFGLAVTPSDSALYVSGIITGHVSVYGPPPTYTAGPTIAVGPNPQNLTISIDGLTVFCANGSADSISVISTASNTVTTTIALPDYIFDLRITPDDKYLYAVTGSSQPAVAFQITTASNTLTDTVTLNSTSAGLATSLDSKQVWFNEVQTGPNLTQVFRVPADTLFGAITWGAPVTPIAIVIVPTSGFKPPPPIPPYPGGQFIPKLFIPIKGKQTVDYTREELRANWLAIEVWSQRWIPPPTVALLIPHKNDPTSEGLNANWITLEVWGQKIQNLGAPYTPLFVPRKTSTRPGDLDIDFLAVQNWANRLPK